MARNAHNTQAYVTCINIATSDTVAISTGPTDAILALTAGNLVLIDGAGNSTTVTVITGTVLPIRVARINATSTTATAAALYY